MSLQEKLTERWAGLWLAGRAVQVDDAQKVLAQNRAAKAMHDRTTAPAEDDPMIHIGDVMNHQAPRPNGLGTLAKLAKLALGAALIATGAGIPLGAGLLLDFLKDKTPPTTIVTPGDGNTQYELDFAK